MNIFQPKKLLIPVLSLLQIATIGLLFYYPNTDSNSHNPQVEAAAPSGEWWNTDYDYRQKLTVTTGTLSPTNGYDGYTVRYTFDGGALVTASKLQSDCDDLRIAYWTGSAWLELDRHILSCNTSSTDIRFQLQANITASSSDDNYYMYYGNTSAVSAPANLSNVYLWYDDASTDLTASYTNGRGDAWHGTGGSSSFAHNASGYYTIDTGDNFTESVRIPSTTLSERDAYIEIEFYHTDAYPNDMSTGVLGRYTLDSGSGSTESSDHYYATLRGDSPFETDSGYSEDISIVEDARTTVSIGPADGSSAPAITGNQWRKQALALWDVNDTNGKYWDNDTATNMGPIGFPTQTVTKSGSDTSADNENTGEWGLIAAQDELRFRNILVRRYTETEPTIAQASEEERAGQGNDFKTQMGFFTISTGTCATITAGVDYDAPSSSSNAFIRLTTTNHTGAGNSTGGGNQNSDDVTVYITNPNNITSSIQFCRIGSSNSTLVIWEIVEYIGEAGGPNEFIVRDAGTVTYGSASTTVSSSTISTVTDDSDVVPFITGAANPETNRNDYNTMQSTADWDSSNDEIDFTRGEAGGDAVRLSYALVEFTGKHWVIQKASHAYTAAGSVETETITDVNDLSRAFLHVQKRIGTNLRGLDEFGHEVWLSDTDEVSFQLEPGAGTPGNHLSQAYVIENTQTNGTPMVVTRSNGTQSGGAEPAIVDVAIGTTVEQDNASIFMTNRVSGTGTAYPRSMIGYRIIDSSNYRVFVSDTGQTRTYRTEVVEWPTTAADFEQEGYRFYANTNSTDIGAPLAAQDTAASLTVVAEEFRLRLLLATKYKDLAISGQDFKLQVAEQSGTCDTAFVGETYTDITASTDIAYNDNSTPSDGDALTANANDPTDLGVNIMKQDYEEANNFTNSESALALGEDGLWDFALIDNSPSAKTYCLRVVKSDGSLLDTYSVIPEVSTNPGSLAIDIVDALGVPVAIPALTMSPLNFDFDFQTSTGTLGVSAERVRIENDTANAQWTASIAADGGQTDLWDGLGANDYDFNDPTAGGLDGGDTDSFGGQMTINPSVATISPEGGCTTSGLTLGSSNSFSEGITNSITLISAGAATLTGCYWDITDIDISQTIPPAQPVGTFSINMTLSVIAI